jgi:hypothetical protein
MLKINEEIKKVFSDWGKETALELKEEAEAALKRGGRKNPNPPTLSFREFISTTSDGDVQLEIKAETLNKKPAMYWRIIDEGRRPGAKQPPSKVFGKVWQHEQQIDPREVLLKIQAKKRPGLKLEKSKMNYERAALQLSYIIARSIKKKGIKPKPYLDRVLTTERIGKLRTKLTPLLGKKFKIIITGLE